MSAPGVSSGPLVAGAAVVAGVMASTGAWLIYSSVVRARRGRPRPPGRSGLPGSSGWPGSSGRRGADWLDSAGLTGVSVSEFGVAVAAVALAGGVVAWLLFGGLVPALVAALFAGTFPVAGYRRRRQARADAALDEWPRLLEELRLRTGSLGRSIPQALFEAGTGAPPEWRPAFDRAEREWLLTVDFARTTAMLKQGLSDPTADAVAETLLVAHEIGGTDLDSKLADLIEDRTSDLQHRRDASSRLAGVRFARRFVLLVPLGMAAAGLTIGTGRQAYASTGGQLAVVAGLVAVAACWWWSGRLMRMPGSPRVFD